MFKKRRTFLLILGILALSVVLAACTGSGTGGQDAKSDQGADLKPGQAGFQEFPIGVEKEAEGIGIAGVYFQAVDMEPKEKAGLQSGEADIHIEADIKGLKNNKTGFGFGDFIPNLQVDYKVKNAATGEEQEGSLMPMNASDGPHYGRNIKMGGAGNYKVTFIIQSPEKMDYLLHVDKETGVQGRFWKQPIEVSWDFNYVPLKK